MLVTLSVFINETLRDEVGNEFDHFNSRMWILDALIENHTHICRKLNMQVDILAIVSLTVHLPKKSRHSRKVSQDE